MSSEEQALLEQVNPIVEAMGFSLVELRLKRSKRQTHVSIVIHRQQGVGVEDCAAVSRTLLPRLELLDWLSGLRLEVSSPGLERELKSPAEFELFKGGGVRVWRQGADDWIDGINQGIVDGALHLLADGRPIEIPMEQVRKAKLDGLRHPG